MQPIGTSRFLIPISLLAALQFALFIGYFPFAIIVTPYGDILDWLTLYYTFPDQSLWQYLFTPHNGHLIIFTRLLTIGDAELLGGLSYPVAFVCMFLWLLISAIAIFGIRRTVTNPSTRQWSTAMMVLLLFPTSSFSNYAYPVNSAFVIGIFFLFLTFVLLANAAFINSKSKLVGKTYFILSLIAAVCASLSSLNGLLVWPILVWATWALRLGLIYTLVLVAICGLLASALVYTNLFPSETTQSIIGLGDIPRIFIYLLEYHGMPWAEIGLLYWPSLVLGTAIFLLSIYFSVKGVLFSRELTSETVVALAMLLFALGSALMIAIGRQELGLLPAHRYGIFLIITCVSLFILNIPRFERWMSNARGRTLVQLVTLVFAVGYLGQQVAVGNFSVQRARAFAQYEKDILIGESQPLGRTAIYFGNVDKIEEYYQLLREQHIYMFRPGSE